MEIPLYAVIVNDRIREDKGSAEEWKLFKESFVKYGQIAPIRVEKLEDGNYKLIAGGRRLLAIKELTAENIVIRNLTPGHIKATHDASEPEHVQLLQEWAENNDRKDFTPIEKAKFIRRFHEKMCETSPGWIQDWTARMLNLSPASISQYLKVEEISRVDQAVAKASTLDAAVRRIKVREQLEARRDAVAKSNAAAIQKAESILTLGDSREWIKTIPDNSVDFIDFDPPWGDNVAHKTQSNHEGFDDSEEYSEELMDALFPHLYRVLKDNRFCAFWFRFWALEQMRAKAESYGFHLTHSKSPCIWYKPDKIGDKNRDPERRLNEAYECFYLLRKGDPVFHERHVNNVFAFDRVRPQIHPTEKPVELCRAILRLCVMAGETILIPCSGSSAMAEAGLRMSNKVLACELSQTYYERGITRLAEVLK